MSIYILLVLRYAFRNEIVKVHKTYLMGLSDHGVVLETTGLLEDVNAI